MDNHGNQSESATRDEYSKMYGICDGFPKTGISVVTASGVLGIGGMRRYIVQTFRAPDAGDTVFVEIIGPDGASRFFLPAKVANAIASQREALTRKSRKSGAKQAARTRKAKGVVPFQKKAKA